MRGVSFDVRAGEIVGIAGVDGNGQTELIDAITGLQKVGGGSVSVINSQPAFTTGTSLSFASNGSSPSNSGASRGRRMVRAAGGGHRPQQQNEAHKIKSLGARQGFSGDLLRGYRVVVTAGVDGVVLSLLAAWPCSEACSRRLRSRWMRGAGRSLRCAMRSRLTRRGILPV